MKFIARSLALVLLTSLAIAGSPEEASACTTLELVGSNQLRASLTTLIRDMKYVEAEAVYAKIVALGGACVVPADHSLGGIVARRQGKLHDAYLRFSLAGDNAAIADLDKAYGQVRIMNAANAPTLRVLSWPGVIVTNPESQQVLEESKRRIIEGGKSVAYLPPGSYFVKTPNKVLLRFEVKAGDRLVLEYK